MLNSMPTIQLELDLVFFEQPLKAIAKLKKKIVSGHQFHIQLKFDFNKKLAKKTSVFSRVKRRVKDWFNRSIEFLQRLL